MRIALVLMFAELAFAQRPEFVQIPAGSFQMGCKPELACSERLPIREIEFAEPFWMGRTEVTVKQFRAFVKATKYITDAEKKKDARTWKSPGFAVKANQPVIFMTLNDATAYCVWIDARLPNEAEWEYAAKAGSTTHHFWGEEMDDRYVWYRGNSDGHPQPVGKKLPNAFGLYDVEGNAWEWATGTGPHTSVTMNGFGTIRGSSFISCPEPYPPKDGVRQRHMGVTVPFEGAPRQNFAPTFMREDTGFRCASSVQPGAGR